MDKSKIYTIGLVVLVVLFGRANASDFSKTKALKTVTTISVSNENKINIRTEPRLH